MLLICLNLHSIKNEIWGRLLTQRGIANFQYRPEDVLNVLHTLNLLPVSREKMGFPKTLVSLFW